MGRSVVECYHQAKVSSGRAGDHLNSSAEPALSSKSERGSDSSQDRRRRALNLDTDSFTSFIPGTNHVYIISNSKQRITHTHIRTHNYICQGSLGTRMTRMECNARPVYIPDTSLQAYPGLLMKSLL